MKRLSKISLASVLLILVAVVALVVYVITNLNFIVERVIEDEGSKVTRTAVRVDKVDIGLREGSASIAGISVANPAGFEFDNAFTLREISTRIDIASVTKSPIVIDHVTIDAPAVFFEVTKDRKINLNELKQNMSPKSAAPEPEQAPAGEPSQVKLLIRRFSMREGTISARLAPLEDKTRELRLPPVEFTNLGGPDGATPAQLSRQIVDKLISRVREEVRKQGWEKQLDEYKQKAGERLDQEKQKIKKEADDRVEQEKQEAKDKLKNLLGQ